MTQGLTSQQKRDLAALQKKGAGLGDVQNFLQQAATENNKGATALGTSPTEFAALQSDITDAAQKLLQNGADPTAIREFLSPANPGAAAIARLIVDNDALIPFWVRRFPSTGMSAYQQAEVGFGFATQLASQKVETRGPSLASSFLTGTGLTGAGQEMTVTQGGVEATYTKQGIIIQRDVNDPTVTPKVLYPNDPKGNIPGSTQWIAKQKGKWDAKTIKRWDKKLTDLGYSTSDFWGAVATAYSDYWANGEKFEAKNPLAGQAGSDVTLRDIFDPEVTKMQVKTMYQNVEGQEPSPEQLQSWTNFLKERDRRLLSRGIDPGQIKERATARMFNTFEATPEAKLFLENNPDSQENTDFRDGVTAAAQAADYLARG